MCISTKILDILFLMFISAHMVLKEKFGHLAQIHAHYNQWKLSAYIILLLFMVKDLLLKKLARKQGQKLEEAKDFITSITSQNLITETKKEL